MTRYVRPPKFHPRIAGEILRRIAEGETLSRVCGRGRRKGMVEILTVYKWMNHYPNFRRAYLVARLAQSERIADEVIDIADGFGPDEAAPRELARDRARMEARRWRAALLAPSHYAAELAALRQEESAEPPEPTDDIALAARIAAIFDSARRRKEAAEAAAAAAAAAGAAGEG